MDSRTTLSSCDAQADIRNAIAKSETPHTVKRGIPIGTNLTGDTLDASYRIYVAPIVYSFCRKTAEVGHRFTQIFTDGSEW